MSKAEDYIKIYYCPVCQKDTRHIQGHNIHDICRCQRCEVLFNFPKLYSTKEDYEYFRDFKEKKE